MNNNEEKRLVIIGNGFDIQSGLKTNFCDFKKFVIENKSEEFLNTFTIQKGNFQGDTSQVLLILYKLIDDSCRYSSWKDFEEALGNIYYCEEINEISKLLRISIDDVASIIKNSSLWLEGYFENWIEEEIDYSKVIKKFEFNDNDTFLSFNYTRTLEECYGIKDNNVCHIHGSKDFKSRKVYEDDFVFGHRRNINEIDYCNNKDIFDTIVILKKDKDKYRKRFQIFLEELRKANITTICDYGFSYLDVDMSYIEEIIPIVNKGNINWYTNIYQSINEKVIRVDKLTKSGFIGNIVVTDNSNKSPILI